MPLLSLEAKDFEMIEQQSRRGQIPNILAWRTADQNIQTSDISIRLCVSDKLCVSPLRFGGCLIQIDLI